MTPSSIVGQPERLALDAIDFDADTRIRAALSETVVTDYAERMAAGDTFPPVVVFHVGSRYQLADGLHRVQAALRNGYTDIVAEVKTGTKEDALWHALGANRTHGHRLTSADKQRAIVLAVQAWPDKSQNQIAEQIGVNQSSVSRVKDKVMRTHNLPDRVVGRDGKTYPSSRPSNASSETSVRVSGGLDKSKTAVRERRQRMRDMAAEGYSSPQMVKELGLSEKECRTIVRREQIHVPADLTIGKTKRIDSARIVEHIVMDAENLVDGVAVDLINFAKLDPAQLVAWIDRLVTSRKAFGRFIRRLKEAQQTNRSAA